MAQLQALGAEGAWLLHIEAAQVAYLDAGGVALLDLPQPLPQLLIVRFPALPAVAAGVEVLAPAPGSCRRCACTDDYACPEGCVWVAADLCSACGGTADSEEPYA